MVPRLYEPVHMIVLTGGPCSGKSTSLAYLVEKLSDHGFMVAVIPETATMITNNGINRHIMDRMGQILAYQEAIVDVQLAMEETYRTAMEKAFPSRKKILLLDRGVMDTKAYLPKKEWENLLVKRRLSEIKLRDRYSGVIHMLTSADGVEDHYSGDGNPARLEKTVEEAIKADRRTRNAWLGHRHFVVIKNQPVFEDKVKKVLNIILHNLGYSIPITGSIRRYLVGSVDYGSFPEHQRISIEQTYLLSRTPGQDVRLKKREQYGTSMFFIVRRDLGMTEKRGVPHEDEEIISEQRYAELISTKNPSLMPVTKERVCFIWENNYYEIDIYEGKNKGTIILETGFTDEAVPLPPFIDVIEEITDNKRYMEKTMAEQKKKRFRKVTPSLVDPCKTKNWHRLPDPSPSPGEGEGNAIDQESLLVRVG